MFTDLRNGDFDELEATAREQIKLNRRAMNDALYIKDDDARIRALARENLRNLEFLARMRRDRATRHKTGFLRIFHTLDNLL